MALIKSIHAIEIEQVIKSSTWSAPKRTKRKKTIYLGARTNIYKHIVKILIINSFHNILFIYTIHIIILNKTC